MAMLGASIQLVQPRAQAGLNSSDANWQRGSAASTLAFDSLLLESCMLLSLPRPRGHGVKARQ